LRGLLHCIVKLTQLSKKTRYYMQCDLYLYGVYILSLSLSLPPPLFLHLTRIQRITRLLEVPCLPLDSRSLRNSEAINLRGSDRFRQVLRAFSHIKVNIPDTIDIIDINNFIFKSNSPKSVYACLVAGIAFLNRSLHRYSCVSSTTFRTSYYVIAMQRVYVLLILRPQYRMYSRFHARIRRRCATTSGGSSRRLFAKDRDGDGRSGRLYFKIAGDSRARPSVALATQRTNGVNDADVLRGARYYRIENRAPEGRHAPVARHVELWNSREKNSLWNEVGTHIGKHIPSSFSRNFGF